MVHSQVVSPSKAQEALSVHVARCAGSSWEEEEKVDPELLFLGVDALADPVHSLLEERTHND